jgi:Protein of unknown function (DUF4235)
MSRDRQSRGFQVFDLMTNLTADGIVRGLAAAGAMFVARRTVIILWRTISGKEPPLNPEDPQVSLPEAVGWAALTAATMQTARLLAIRAADNRMRSGSDREPASTADG